MTFLGKIRREYSRLGLRGVSRKGLTKLLRKLDLVEDVQFRRWQITSSVDRKLHSTVAYGPFTGFRFLPENRWSGLDRAGMLLGIYEQEVLAEIVAAAPGRRIFIDIGAADGYYAVAVVSQGLFERALCFEISEHGQDIIRRTATLNGVAERVDVVGAASVTELASLEPNLLESAVILIDIEGAEFDFLTEGVVRLMRNAIVLIELHDWAVPDGARRLSELDARLGRYFDRSVLRTGSRDPGQFAELAGMDDTDRWLLCSEGRSQLMQWWKLSPKA